MAESKEEFSIRNSIAVVKKAVKILTTHKVILLVGVLIGIILGILRAHLSKPQYNAEITFMLDSGQGGGKMSALMGLVSQFGVGGGGSMMNEEKLIAIAKSNTVISNTLLRQSIISGKKDFNINHYLRDVRKITRDSLNLKLLITHNKSSERTIQEDSVLNAYVKIFSNKLLVFAKSKEGIITVKLKTSNEQFSKQFIDDFTANILNYFSEKTTAKKRMSYGLVEKTADSLYRELINKEDQWASATDGSQRMVMMKGKLRLMELQREIKILNILHAEALKNLEMLRFDMMYDSPVIQIIDRPILPLEVEKRSMIMGVIGGIFIGGMLASIFIFAMMGYKRYWKHL